MANYLIPSGVILIWGSTNATIPAGWTRETTLDTRYPKAWSAGVAPNNTGGANTHTHTGSHTHTSNSHTHTYTTTHSTLDSALDGGWMDNPADGIAAGHDHNVYGTNTSGALTGGGLQSTTVTWASVNQEPPYYTVIFIKSSSGFASLTAGVCGHYHGSNIPGGWYYCDGSNSTPDLRNRYLKGASAGGNSGSTGGGTSHNHTLNHTHTVTAHSHASAYSTAGNHEYLHRDSRYGDLSYPASAFNHVHLASFGNTASSIAGYVGSSGSSTTVEIAYKKLGVIQNNGGDVALGLVGLWLGSAGSLPDNWVLCDGSNGTPDLRDKFVKIGSSLANNSETGGANTHTHTAVSHTHSATGTHSHTCSLAADAGSVGAYYNNRGASYEGYSPRTHAHTSENNSLTTEVFANSNISADTVSNQPAYTTVAYIRYNVTPDITNNFSVKASIVRTESFDVSVRSGLLTGFARGFVKNDIIRIDEQQDNSTKANFYWIISHDCSTKMNIVHTTPQETSARAYINAHAFNKYFEYRIYDKDGVFLTTWSKDVLSEPSFKIVINGGPGELIVRLARDFDSFGEDEDISLFNRVDVYCFDRDSVNGVLIYSGYVSGYRPVLDGPVEYIEITLLHYITEMFNIMLRDGTGSTDVTMNSTDPSQMLKSAIDYYRTDGGHLNYTSSSIAMTSTSVSYDFKTYNVKEAADKIIELTPMYWYWFADADNLIYLQYSDLTSAQHSFVVGRHISKMETWRRGEDLVNRVYFVGAETAGVAMYRMYSNSASISSYGIHAEKVVDQRVSLTTTADIIANRIINRKKDPEIRTTITILDNNGWDSGKGYDIESIKPGQTMRIKNLKQGVKTVTRWDQFEWDEDVWDQTLSYSASDNIQIQSVEYHPDYVVLEASSRLPDIAKRVEDVYRNLEESQTISTPGTPTSG